MKKGNRTTLFLVFIGTILLSACGFSSPPNGRDSQKINTNIICAEMVIESQNASGVATITVSLRDTCGFFAAYILLTGGDRLEVSYAGGPATTMTATSFGFSGVRYVATITGVSPDVEFKIDMIRPNHVNPTSTTISLPISSTLTLPGGSSYTEADGAIDFVWSPFNTPDRVFIWSDYVCGTITGAGSSGSFGESTGTDSINIAYIIIGTTPTGTTCSIDFTHVRSRAAYLSGGWAGGSIRAEHQSNTIAATITF